MQVCYDSCKISMPQFRKLGVIDTKNHERGGVYGDNSLKSAVYRIGLVPVYTGRRSNVSRYRITERVSWDRTHASRVNSR